MSIAQQASTPEDVIKMRAYAIWENEGRPEGKHLEHWRVAAREVAVTADAPKTIAAAAPKKHAKGQKREIDPAALAAAQAKVAPCYF